MKIKHSLCILTVLSLFNNCNSLKEVSIDNIEHTVKAEPVYYSCSVSYCIKPGENKKYCTEENKKAAIESYVYSLMSSNAYEDKPQFIIPGWKRVARYKSPRGFSADIYEAKIKGTVKTVVIAFRGTDGFWDFIFGNFNFYWKGEYKDAENLFKIVKKKYEDIPIVVTGHSLGGGLALHISLLNKGINAYVFNTSPRVFAEGKYHEYKNRRVVLDEKGQVLRRLREKWPTLDQFKPEIYEYNFLQGNAIQEHSCYKFARAITGYAAYLGDKKAQNIMNINLGCNNIDCL